MKNNSKKGLREIPEQTFDMQTGFFDPVTNIIHSYDGSEMLRRADQTESRMIKEKFRYEPSKDYQ